MIQVPRLREDRITVGRPQEVQVDVSQDPSRMVFDRSRPAYLTGTRIAYRVPFVGDGLLFRYRPSQYTFNPPRASVGNDELLFIYDRVNPDAAALQQEFERERASVQEWLSWAASDAEGFNNELVPGLQLAIESRLARLRENDDLGGKLGYPIE